MREDKGYANRAAMAPDGLLAESANEASMPIAIVGLSCRFPGDATSPDKLWKLCAEGRSAWSEIPEDRFNRHAFYHPHSDNHGTSNVKGAHFMTEDVSLFDATFFNFSAEVAASMDPQVRLQLESVYEAMESAGIPLQNFAGTDTSVFAGAFFRDYHDSLLRDPETLPRSFLTGNGAAMVSNRVSHFFDLMGSSVTVDTGCSTGLTALHLGCQSIRSGESKISIIGGANIMLNPDMFISMSSIGFLGADGRSYAFDHRAHGYGRGEGIATLIIKSLQDALKDGDPIRAVIRETLLNQDGKSSTITSPSQAAQSLLIGRTYANAGLNPLNTTYVEAHGTGTSTGDPVEAGAIGAIFKQGRPADKPLFIGSVKSNIGHLEATSGIASVIKVALAFENEAIPPSGNFEKPNPAIDFDGLNLKASSGLVFLSDFETYLEQVPTKLESWPTGQTRRASVSNFGYGGTNAHVIMDDPRRYTRPKDGKASCIKNGKSDTWRVFMLSAKDEGTTQNIIRNLRGYLQSREQPDDENAFLESLAFTLSSRRTIFPWLAAVPAQNFQGLTEALDTIRPAHGLKTPRLGFVFNGQGAQWYAMGRELIATYPIFEESLRQGDEYMKRLGAPFSLIEELGRDQRTSRVNEALMSLPLCCAIQISLVNLLRSWNIDPTAVTGHSSGEVSAAYAAGAIDFSESLAIAYIRGYLTTHTLLKSGLRGSMLAVGLGHEEVEPYLAEVSTGKVVVACVNSQSSITLSGDSEAVEEIRVKLSEKNIFARQLQTPAAYHSHHMEGLAESYLEGLEKNLKGKGDFRGVLYYSPVTGDRFESAKALGPGHWVQNMVQPVLFKQSLSSMLLPETFNPGETQTVDIIVEVGPHKALAGPIRQVLGTPELKNVRVSYETCLVRGENAVQTMQKLACSLLRQGYPVDLEAINLPQTHIAPKVLHNLPTYPWNHSNRHWLEPRVNREYRARRSPPHDLLGSLLKGSNPLAPTWRHFIRPSEIPWVRDHLVQSDMVYPGAGCIVMAIEAMRQISDVEQDSAGYSLKDVEIMKALVIPDTPDGVEVQLVLRSCSEKSLDPHGWQEFHLYSISNTGSWDEHCKGLISAQSRNVASPLTNNFDASPRTYNKCLHPSDLFKSLRSMGIHHGSSFQNLISIQSGQNRSKATFSIANSASLMPAQFECLHLLHPITLDALLQSAYAAVPAAAAKAMGASIPRSIESMFVSTKLTNTVGHHLQAFTTLHSQDSQGFGVSITTMDADGMKSAPLIKIDGLYYRSLGAAAPKEQNENVVGVCLRAQWRPDLALMGSKDLMQVLSRQPNPTEATVMADLKRVTYHFVHDALSALTEADINRLEWHHRLLYNWMQIQERKASRNELAPRSAKWSKASEGVKQLLFDKVSSISVDGRLLVRIGKSLLAIMRRQVYPMDLMLEENLLETYYEKGLKVEGLISQVAQLVSIFGHHNPRANILEIGAGSGACTGAVLEALGGGDSGRPPKFFHYTFTDISSGFFEHARKDFGVWGDQVSYIELDIEKNTAEQSFREASFDLVIASRVLHVTKNIDSTMSNIRKLLKPGGRLIIVETTQEALDMQMVFGTLSDWWSIEEKDRAHSPHLPSHLWENALRRAGFSGLDVDAHDCEERNTYTTSVMLSTAVAPAHPTLPTKVVLLYGQRPPPTVWLDELKHSIAAATSLMPEVASLDRADSDASVYIFLADIDETTLLNLEPTRFNAIRNLVAGAKGIMWISRGGAIECEVPGRSLHSGLLRTLRWENRSNRYITLDLDPRKPPWTSSGVEAILRVFKAAFTDEVDRGSIDFEYAERDSLIHVARFSDDDVENDAISNTSNSVPNMIPYHHPGRELKMGVEQPGSLDSLVFKDDPSVSDFLPEDFVEIESKAFGLNFRDIMVGMGQMEEKIMGFECSGIVTKIGANVSHTFRPGDRVCAIISTGGWSSFQRLHWTGLAHIPDDTTYEAAASIPMVFVTAYYCLYESARLLEGESVLIHASSGGVGQAAIMLAKHIGADIFVTVSTPEKKQFIIDTYDVDANHVFSSRDPSFATDLMSATGGRGVDVVLNSLSGALLQESWNCVAHLGRFIEIGKRDIQANKYLQMKNFGRAISFSAIDLIHLATYKRPVQAKVMQEISRLMAQKVIKTITPITVYPISEIQRAFRTMQAGRHIGKIVIAPRPGDLVKVLPAKANTSARSSPDASYVVVGGLGGIGRSVTQMLVDRGAKHLILLSRSAATQKSSQVFLEELREAGCNVTTRNCDISRKDDLASVKNDCLRTMPPVRGVIHAAMFLSDSVFERMSFEQWQGTTSAKVAGSMNLHTLFPDLEFFIMLSSLTGIVGNTSQANYTAGGSFQDAFAQYRTAHGLPALSIDLGMVKSVGYVAKATGVSERLSKIGYVSVEEDEVLRIIESAIETPMRQQRSCQVVTGLASFTNADGILWREDLRFQSLQKVSVSGRGSNGSKEGNRFEDSLAQALSWADVITIVTNVIIKKLSEMFMLPPDEFDGSQPMSKYGVDSLVAVELRNWLVAHMQAEMSIFDVLQSTSISALAAKTATKSSHVLAAGIAIPT